MIQCHQYAGAGARQFNSVRSQVGIADLPADSRPRERLLHLGERALSSSELLALVIGTGHRDANALRLSRAMLTHFGDLAGLVRASTTELKAFKGSGLFPTPVSLFCSKNSQN
jgi:DNA repair protein RadC